MQQSTPTAALPRLTINYCTRCNWLLRAAWLAQEVLQRFAEEIGEVALRPGAGGEFTLLLTLEDGSEHLIWERKRDGGFPEAKQIKQRLRDLIAPQMDLGHGEPE
ncbi:MAG TPA: hypothetical protein DCF45_02945 [Gammaproteobacteria bacterium]|nr:hypothetical protein [Gammaproteobacteria bacterium]